MCYLKERQYAYFRVVSAEKVRPVVGLDLKSGIEVK
jgi:hypothetical protein